MKVNFSVLKPVSFAFFLFIISLFSATAQKRSADSNRVLLAAATPVETARYIVKEANVVFPDILKGNEEQSMEFIQDFSSKRKAYLDKMYLDGRKLLPQAEAILKNYNLPKELAVLLAIESAYKANALSKAGAVGYWQIMDETAKEYGIKYISKHRTVVKKIKTKKGIKRIVLVDERKDFDISTDMAARYLSDRQGNLENNLLLMVASYNCGLGNVNKAMKKSGVENPGFWDIKKYLPKETQAYVMKFITLNVIFHNYELFSKNQLVFAPEKLMISQPVADMDLPATD